MMETDTVPTAMGLSCQEGGVIKYIPDRVFNCKRHVRETKRALGSAGECPVRGGF